MNRHVALLALAVLAGCYKGKIEEAGKKLEAVQAQRSALNAELAAVQADNETLTKDTATLQTASVSAARQISIAERSMVTLWKGHPPTLKKILDKVALPAALLPAVQHAQASVGGETVEQTMARSLSEENLGGLATLLGGWETDARVSIAEPAEEEDAAACALPKPRPRCSVLKGDAAVALCTDPETKSQWLLRVDNGFLLSARLPDPEDNKMELTTRVTPSLYLVEGTGKLAIEGSPPMTRWVDVIQFAGDRATRKARWPLRIGEGAGARNGTLLVIDADGDGREDVVHAFGEMLHALREAPRNLEISELKTPEVCARLRAAKKVDDGFAVACTEKKPLPLVK